MRPCGERCPCSDPRGAKRSRGGGRQERRGAGHHAGRLDALIESPGIHLGLTGLDNVMVGALAYGWLLDAFRDGVPIVVAGVAAASLVLSLAVRSVVREGLKGDGEGAEAPACVD